MNKYLALLIVIFVIFSFTYVYSQTTTIEDIRRQPGKFEGANVTVTGLVTQYVQGIGPTSYYIIKGDYGGTIKVNTADQAPETYKKYIVSGIVYLDKDTRRPFISERSKTLLTSNAEQNQTVQPQKLEQSAPTSPKKDYILIIVVICILIVALILLLYLMNKKPFKRVSQDVNDPQQLVSIPVSVSEDYQIEANYSDFKTIRITNTLTKTLKFIPGELVITTGEDKGKSFRIAGYPTPEGSVVTIGREEVTGERSYAHIQLMQKTISRKQAEIIYLDGIVFVKNLSETNYTQVNGIELKPGEKIELKPNSTIRTGEIEFQYKV